MQTTKNTDVNCNNFNLKQITSKIMRYLHIPITFISSIHINKIKYSQLRQKFIINYTETKETNYAIKNKIMWNVHKGFPSSRTSWKGVRFYSVTII